MNSGLFAPGVAKRKNFRSKETQIHLAISHSSTESAHLPLVRLRAVGLANFEFIVHMHICSGIRMQCDGFPIFIPEPCAEEKRGGVIAID